jgi:hypothetical protein
VCGPAASAVAPGTGPSLRWAGEPARGPSAGHVLDLIKGGGPRRSEGRDELSRVARLLAEDLQGGPVIALAIKLIRDTLIRTGRTLNGADGSALPVETERKCVQLLADGIEQVLRSVEREAAQEMELAAAIAEEKTTRTSSTRWAKAPDGSRGFACSRSPS